MNNTAEVNSYLSVLNIHLEVSWIMNGYSVHLREQSIGEP